MASFKCPYRGEIRLPENSCLNEDIRKSINQNYNSTIKIKSIWHANVIQILQVIWKQKHYWFYLRRSNKLMLDLAVIPFPPSYSCVCVCVFSPSFPKKQTKTKMKTQWLNDALHLFVEKKMFIKLTFWISTTKLLQLATNYSCFILFWSMLHAFLNIYFLFFVLVTLI